MFGFIAFLCAAALYLLPAIVAPHRQQVSFGAIFLINLLLGWSIIGWIVGFAWSGSGATRHEVVVLPPAYRR